MQFSWLTDQLIFEKLSHNYTNLCSKKLINHCFGFIEEFVIISYKSSTDQEKNKGMNISTDKTMRLMDR